jgi:hypothetical protein
MYNVSGAWWDIWCDGVWFHKTNMPMWRKIPGLDAFALAGLALSAAKNYGMKCLISPLIFICDSSVKD